MDQPRHDPQSSGMTRRSLLQAGTASLALAAASAVPSARASASPEDNAVEWRNKQPGMAYRRLGRTGMMISEIVCGGDPITLDNYKHLELALEMGLNYLDMAPAYNGGDTERAFGKLLAASPGRRDKVFLTTKISDFTRVRERLYQQVFDGLPATRQEAIRAEAKSLRDRRRVELPGYFLTYYPGQQSAFEPAYLRIAMMKEYGAKIEGSPELRKVIVESLEGSLQRLGTDHVDLMMCPHGANAPEDLTPELVEVFRDLKAQGKVRFLGVTSHNDPAGVLGRAVELGHYDAVMMAYNVINGGFLAEAIGRAAAKDVGLIAMKAAHAVATHHETLKPVPEWRVAKVERVVPGDWKAPQKAYLWALQDPRIAAVISNLWDETYVKENLGLAGKKVELRSA